MTIEQRVKEKGNNEHVMTCALQIAANTLHNHNHLLFG